MMHYIQFATADGGTILVEAAEESPDRSGVVRAGLGDKVQETVVEARATFEEAIESVRHSAAALIEKVRDLTDPPDEVEVTFGLKATGEVGNFAIAKAGVAANYTVKLVWKREQKTDS
jgi:hypothetical protein